MENIDGWIFIVSLIIGMVSGFIICPSEFVLIGFIIALIVGMVIKICQQFYNEGMEGYQ
jgi:uncharacterized membrane protein (DUF106 family)